MEIQQGNYNIQGNFPTMDFLPLNPNSGDIVYLRNEHLLMFFHGDSWHSVDDKQIMIIPPNVLQISDKRVYNPLKVER